MIFCRGYWHRTLCYFMEIDVWHELHFSVEWVENGLMIPIYTDIMRVYRYHCMCKIEDC